MEIPDLSYQLNVDCPNYEALHRWFHEEWVDFGIEWRIYGQGSTPENWIEIQKFHKNLASPYPYYILVASRRNTAPDLNMADLNRQVDFTRLLISRLREKGCIVEFSGYFEEYL
jgi:hypothetical protein